MNKYIFGIFVGAVIAAGIIHIAYLKRKRDALLAVEDEAEE